MKYTPAYKIAFMGVSAALTAALTAAESMFLTPFIPIPGVRLGLANCVIILVMLICGITPASMLSVFRSAFVMLTRGFTAGIMSLCGGVCSFLALILLINVLKCSYIFSSVISSAIHVAAQTVCSAVIIGSPKALYYIPVLIPAAICTGICTGIIITQLYSVIKGGRYFEKIRRNTPEPHEKYRK